MKSSRNLYIAILTALSLLLASCNSTPPAAVNIEEPDQILMQPPPKAPLLPEGPLLLGDLVLADQELARLYNELRERMLGLQKYIRAVIERTKKKPP